MRPQHQTNFPAYHSQVTSH